MGRPGDGVFTPPRCRKSAPISALYRRRNGGPSHVAPPFRTIRSCSGHGRHAVASSGRGRACFHHGAAEPAGGAIHRVSRCGIAGARRAGGGAGLPRWVWLVRCGDRPGSRLAAGRLPASSLLPAERASHWYRSRLGLADYWLHHRQLLGPLLPWPSLVPGAGPLGAPCSASTSAALASGRPAAARLARAGSSRAWWAGAAI